MDKSRILELALETLEKQRTEIEREIEEIREFQDGKKRVFARNPEISALVVVTRRSRTPAERKAQSERMKQYWAQKKAPAASKTAGVRTKVRAWTAAEKKALSLRMKEVWKRRAAAAKKSKT